MEIFKRHRRLSSPSVSKLHTVPDLYGRPNSTCPGNTPPYTRRKSSTLDGADCRTFLWPYTQAVTSLDLTPSVDLLKPSSKEGY